MSKDVTCRPLNVLIIGGSAGVGLAITKKIHKKFQNVCVVSRNLDNLNIVKELDHESNIITFQGDVADKDCAKYLSAHLNDLNFGTVDVIICNAGGPPPKRLLDTNDDDWNSALNTSLLGYIRLVREFIPSMIRNKYGRIVFISSTVVNEPSPEMILSATSRAGLTAFINSASKEFAQFDITLNNIYLGGILTERLKSLIIHKANVEKQNFDSVKEELLSQIPAKRFADPSEVASLVNFLISDEASYITGTSIPIDGGLLKGIY